MGFCTKCGKKHGFSDKFCATCGAPLKGGSGTVSNRATAFGSTGRSVASSSAASSSGGGGRVFAGTPSSKKASWAAPSAVVTSSSGVTLGPKRTPAKKWGNVSSSSASASSSSSSSSGRVISTSRDQSTFGGSNVTTRSDGVVKCGLPSTTYEKQPAWATAERHKNSAGQWKDGSYSTKRV